MGGYDHPTTGLPYRKGRFGSTHCYPDDRLDRFLLQPLESTTSSFAFSREWCAGKASTAYFRFHFQTNVL